MRNCAFTLSAFAFCTREAYTLQLIGTVYGTILSQFFDALSLVIDSLVLSGCPVGVVRTCRSVTVCTGVEQESKAPGLMITA